MIILTRKILLVILPVVLLAITFEILARTLHTSYSIKHDKLIRKKNDVEILVLGSSHSNFGINPQYFGYESFNLSNTSQDLYYDYSLLLKYLPVCKNIKIVILPVSYFTLFNRGLNSGIESWRTDYYSFYLKIPNPANSFFNLTQYSALFLWDGPINIIKNFKQRSININEYGYQHSDVLESNTNNIISNATGKKRVKLHQNIMDEKYINGNVDIIDKIVKECISRKIKIVFITTPVYKTYSDNISKKYYDIMIDTIKKITTKYSANSYNYFYDERFCGSDFIDNDHLNDAGATKFSIILKNEVINKLMYK